MENMRKGGGLLIAAGIFSIAAGILAIFTSGYNAGTFIAVGIMIVLGIAMIIKARIFVGIMLLIMTVLTAITLVSTFSFYLDLVSLIFYGCPFLAFLLVSIGTFISKNHSGFPKVAGVIGLILYIIMIALFMFSFGGFSVYVTLMILGLVLRALMLLFAGFGFSKWFKTAPQETAAYQPVYNNNYAAPAAPVEQASPAGNEENVTFYVTEPEPAPEPAVEPVSEPAPEPVKPEAPKGNVDDIFKYKKMLDAGIITEEEFNTKKKEILGL